MEAAAFTSDVETRCTANNNYYNASYDDAIDNLEDKFRLDGDSSKKKMSIGDCDEYESPCVDNSSIGDVLTEASTYASDADDIINAGYDFECAIILDDDS